MSKRQSECSQGQRIGSGGSALGRRMQEEGDVEF